MSAVAIVELWYGSTPPTRLGCHEHACPLCYDDDLCVDECSIEVDLGLSSGGLPYGHHTPCDRCVAGGTVEP